MFFFFKIVNSVDIKFGYHTRKIYIMIKISWVVKYHYLNNGWNTMKVLKDMIIHVQESFHWFVIVHYDKNRDDRDEGYIQIFWNAENLEGF